MPARITPTRETRTAYHEAGHAVIAFFSSTLPRVRRVTIVPTPTLLGHVRAWRTPTFRPDLNEDARTTLRILQEIPALLAGTVAERRLGGRYDHVGAESDREKAVDLACYICAPGTELDAFMRWQWRRTETAVAVRWAAIEAVAAALLAEKSLDGQRLRELILATKPADR